MLDTGHSSALAIDAWQHSSNISCTTHVVEQGPHTGRGVDDHSAKMLVLWFFVHCEVMQVRHRSGAPGEHEGPRSKGRRRKGQKCWVFEGTRAEGAGAEGAREGGVGVCVCV